MKNESVLLPAFRVGIIIFIPLAILLSLFPPYYWGNEKIRTLSERRRSDIDDQLPIKSYDLLFGSNKKLFKLGSYTFTNKYYENEFNSLDKILSDATGFKFISGIDTFSTKLSYAYKMTDAEKIGVLKEEQAKYKQSQRRGRNSRQKIFNFVNWRDFSVEHADNFEIIKHEYLKAPNDWNTRWVNKIDSVKSFRNYTIKKPNYYLLGREIILSELFINYLLAFFLSTGLGLLFVKFKERKRD